MVKELILGTSLAVLVLLIIWGVDVTPFVLLGGLAVFFRYAVDMRSPSRSSQRVGVQHAPQHASPVTFEDIGGQETAKRELVEALDFIKESDVAKNLGIRPLKGILLTGPPGTGKTLMAKAAAHYADAVFFSASGSEFVEVYAGVGAQRVRRLFKQAKSLADKEGKKSAVIFIDEIEVLGAKRGKHGSHMEYDQTLNELLVQLDGMDTQSKDDGIHILVMAATNRPDLLDPALLRPGRFDRTVPVEMPDRDGRRHILGIHTKKRPISSDVDLDLIARETYGLSGADLESVVNEAAIYAMREGSHQIEKDHFKEAIEKVMMGERLDRKPRLEERERIAYHEAGHALISELVMPNSVTSITITSRGRALGYMRQAPMDDPYLQTKQELLDQIAVCLAGACAEEVFFGSRSTGAVGDLRQVMNIAEQIVSSGMSSLGVVDMEVISARVLHDEMQRIVKEQEAYVLRQVEACRDQIREVACLLLEREKLSGEEFRAVLGPLAPITVCTDVC